MKNKYNAEISGMVGDLEKEIEKVINQFQEENALVVEEVKYYTDKYTEIGMDHKTVVKSRPEIVVTTAGEERRSLDRRRGDRRSNDRRLMSMHS